MAIVLQTLVKNLLKTDRKIPWIDKKGAYCAGGESIVVEGAYPSACTSPAKAQVMQTELDQGLIEVALITNMAVMEPITKDSATLPNVDVLKAKNIKKVEDAKKKERQAEARKKKAAEKNKSKASQDAAKSANEEVFAKDGIKEPQPQPLIDNETDTTLPESKEIFKDAPQDTGNVVAPAKVENAIQDSGNIVGPEADKVFETGKVDNPTDPSSTKATPNKTKGKATPNKTKGKATKSK
jgi:hypothetical protein